MISIGFFLVSIFIGLFLNIIIVKVIGTFDYEVLGLKKKSRSVFKIYRYIFKDKRLLIKFTILEILFIFLNYIIICKISSDFSLASFNIYLRYYYLFLILYIFAFIDCVTYYVYTVLSYPIIICSSVLFILSFLDTSNIKSNIETLVLIGFLYIIINKFKFLGNGDFDILLIVSLTVGVLPTIFIFYLSIIMSGVIGIALLIKDSFKLKNNKLAFIPFIFLSSSLFIILGV